MVQTFLKNLATLFGLGKISKAPGTIGTLATIPLVYLLSLLGPFAYMAVTLVLVLVSIASAQAYENSVEGHDHKEIIIDEVVGFLVAMTWLPMTWNAILIGFLLFRALDILKPFPIGYLDKKVEGGLGVVVDDLVAGIIASVALQFLYQYTHLLGSQVMVFSS